MSVNVEYASWWLRLHDYFSRNVHSSAVVTSIFAFVLYWVIGTFYVILAITGRPAFLDKYKVQPRTKTGGKQIKKRLPQLIRQVVVNQVFVGIPMLFVASKILEQSDRYLNPNLPTPLEIVLHLGIFILLEEVGFYYCHRLLHHPILYKSVHKKHHEWKQPVAITALYCHPLEQAVCNMAPVLWGPLLVNPHVVTFWIWMTITVLTTLSDHSGYHFPFCRSPQGHDFHHLTFNEFYGVLGFLDWLHGTDKTFRASKQFQNHKLFMSFEPRPQYAAKHLQN